MNREPWDLVVLGAGGGGYPAALRLAGSGRRVLMVDDKGNLGGNCLYEGCIPSKAVRQASIVWQQFGQAAYFGLQARPMVAAWDGIRQYKDGVQTRRYAQHQQEIGNTPNLTMVRGRGRLLDARRIEIEDWDRGTTVKVEAIHILIAAGSEADTLSIAGFDKTWNHHDLFAWNHTQPTLPKTMVILGGGYIGVESASMLQDLGVEVTLLEMAPAILGHMDPDLVQAVSQPLGRRVKLVTGVEVDRIEERDRRYTVVGHPIQGGQELTWETDCVLAAVGRRPAIDVGLGLDAAGVDYSRQGIAVDMRMHTNIPHIYAAGDVNGLSMLFHSAVRMSEIVAQDILWGSELQDRFNPLEMPTTVFSRPEAFSVGLTREAARHHDIHVVERSREMGVEAWAQIAGELEGFIKMVVNVQTGKIVGMHGVGIDAAALSAVAHMAIHQGLTPRQLGQMTFPHPTQFEIVAGLARSF